MGLFGFRKKESVNKINWIELTEEKTLNDIVEASKDKPVLILKHSTRCSISSMALNRIENNWNFEDDELTPYYLDLIQYRNVSNEIADKFRIMHQSPQILLIKNGECVLTASHNSINTQIIKVAL